MGEVENEREEWQLISAGGGCFVARQLENYYGVRRPTQLCDGIEIDLETLRLLWEAPSEEYVRKHYFSMDKLRVDADPAKVNQLYARVQFVELPQCASVHDIPYEKRDDPVILQSLVETFCQRYVRWKQMCAYTARPRCLLIRHEKKAEDWPEERIRQVEQEWARRLYPHRLYILVNREQDYDWKRVFREMIHTQQTTSDMEKLGGRRPPCIVPMSKSKDALQKRKDASQILNFSARVRSSSSSSSSSSSVVSHQEREENGDKALTVYYHPRHQIRVYPTIMDKEEEEEATFLSAFSRSHFRSHSLSPVATIHLDQDNMDIDMGIVVSRTHHRDIANGRSSLQENSSNVLTVYSKSVVDASLLPLPKQEESQQQEQQQEQEQEQKQEQKQQQQQQEQFQCSHVPTSDRIKESRKARKQLQKHQYQQLFIQRREKAVRGSKPTPLHPSLATKHHPTLMLKKDQWKQKWSSSSSTSTIG